MGDWVSMHPPFLPIPPIVAPGYRRAGTLRHCLTSSPPLATAGATLGSSGLKSDLSPYRGILGEELAGAA
eukprot:5107150-Pyramimonas_sp.AAC.1